jgi:hypothetical protein
VSAEHPWAGGAAAAVTDGWPTWPREVHAEDGVVTTFVLIAFDALQGDGGERHERLELDARLLARADS